MSLRLAYQLVRLGDQHTHLRPHLRHVLTAICKQAGLDVLGYGPQAQKVIEAVIPDNRKAQDTIGRLLLKAPLDLDIDPDDFMQDLYQDIMATGKKAETVLRDLAKAYGLQVISSGEGRLALVPWDSGVDQAFAEFDARNLQNLALGSLGEKLFYAFVGQKSDYTLQDLIDLKRRVIRKLNVSDFPKFDKRITNSFVKHYLQPGGPLGDQGSLLPLVNFLNENPLAHRKINPSGTLEDAMDIALEELSQLPTFDEDRVMMRFPNGYYWYHVTGSECAIEGNYMLHCGRSDSEMYSLRNEHNRPHVTVEYNPRKRMILQIRGKANTTPKRKYAPYIKAFIRDKRAFLNVYEMEGWLHQQFADRLREP